MAYYRAVMRSDAARSREAAVGSKSHESWLQLGQLQFDYLLGHGLKPSMRMLEIGCGNLRAGRLFVGYLDAGNYYGIDISPDILLAAHQVVADYGLAGQAAAPGAGRPTCRWGSCPTRCSMWCTRTACSRTPRWRSSTSA